MEFAWGAAGRPIAGESNSGDSYLVLTHADGLLMAVVDGLGHGAEAALAACAAIRAIEENGHQPLVPLFEHCHAALQGSRGVAMTVAHCSRSSGQLTWMGVGNVEALIVRVVDGEVVGTDHVMLRNGVVGMRLPRLQVSQQRVAPGDLLVFATDGIRSRFAADLDPRGTPCEIANRILDRHGRDTDDSLVLVVRYRGPDSAGGSD